jgi:diadenosine tetraphosphate (Ap4A) HIT family hydrolase
MKLDPRLENDSKLIRKLNVSQLRIMNDGEVPWFILIPELNDCNELTELDMDDQIKLLEEINFVSDVIKENCKVDKLNIASIGNVVSQLHIHIIGRYNTDRAWPGTIWGTKGQKELDEISFAKWSLAFSE